MTKVHSQSSGSKYLTLNYYIDAEYEDGTKGTFNVKSGTAQLAMHALKYNTAYLDMMTKPWKLLNLI